MEQKTRASFSIYMVYLISCCRTVIFSCIGRSQYYLAIPGHVDRVIGSTVALLCVKHAINQHFWCGVLFL